MNLRVSLFAVLAVCSFAACGNNNQTSKKEGQNTTPETAQAPEETSADVKKVAVTYPQVDTAVAAGIKSAVDHYLHVKNALAGDNAAEAAKGAEALGAALSKIDKSLFSPEQKTAYDKAAGELRNHAAQIAKNGSDIKQQREHFVAMSEGVYALAKTFGGGRTLYHEHCPMAKNNQGAMWLSESKEIRNPYFGAEMLECGTVEEMIQSVQP